MSENNNIEFTFDYNEAETVDRLISLEDTLDMLEQLYHRKFIANKRTSDIAFVNMPKPMAMTLRVGLTTP